MWAVRGPVLDWPVPVVILWYVFQHFGTRGVEETCSGIDSEETLREKNLDSTVRAPI